MNLLPLQLNKTICPLIQYGLLSVKLTFQINAVNVVKMSEILNQYINPKSPVSILLCVYYFSCSGYFKQKYQCKIRY